MFSYFQESYLKHSKIVLITITYIIVAKFGIFLFAIHPGNITLLWLASGIGMIMAYQYRMLSIPFVFIASIVANFNMLTVENVAFPIVHLIIAAGADTLAAILAAVLFRKWLPNGFDRVVAMIRFVFIVALISTTVSSIIIVVNLVVGHYIGWSNSFTLLRTLVMSDSLGMMLIFPLYYSWNWQFNINKKKLINFLLLSLLLVSSIYLSFNGFPGLIFFVLPLFLLITFIVSLRSVSLLLLLTIILSIGLSSNHFGPFFQINTEEAIFMVIAFVVSTTFVTMSISIYYRELMETTGLKQQFKHDAEHDALTGLWNRRAIETKLHSEHEKVKIDKHPYTFAILDVDLFKRVNDTYGHIIGDTVLQQVAKTLRKNIRSIDSVARYGGEEFIVLFPETNREEAEIILERIRKAVETTAIVFDENQTLNITISIGAATYLGDLHTFKEVYADADKMLYKAKNGGRNQICMM